MAVMKIFLYGEEVLRQKASPVEEVDDGVRELIRNMAETMRQANGVGLAAPQVGDSRRIIMAEVPQEQKGLIALVNPKIVESSGTSEFEEGCLSIPGITAKVKRAAEVVVEGLTPDGEEVRNKYTGLLATVMQHEIDHLEGVLFVDRLGFLGRSALSFKLKGLAKANKR
jgi:peptide deformylase